MRIGIDARVLQHPDLKNKGIGTYTYNLISELLKLNTKHQFIFYLFKNNEMPEILQEQEITWLPQYKRLNFIFQQFNTLKGGVDVFHTPIAIGPSREIIMPYLQFKRVIGTVHDLTFYHLPDGWSQSLSRSKDYRLQVRALRKAKKIITDSNYVKKDLEATLKLPSEKVTAIYLGWASHVFKPLENINAYGLQIRKKYGITKKFILGVGDENDYKKNIPTLFAVISSFPEFQLVVVGNSKQSNKQTIKQSNIVFTGKVSENELCALYNLAEVLVFPSFAEGFGLPPLEAMACGCPVIASNRWSLPEVVGDGGILVEPCDVKGIVVAVKKLLEDSSFKKELVNKGFKQTERFSWRKCASETLKVYEEIANEY